MPDSSEFRLGELRGAFDAMRREVVELRREGHQREASILASIRRTDELCERRFGTLDQRLDAIERQASGAGGRHQVRREHGRRLHEWHMALLAALVTIGCAIGGSWLVAKWTAEFAHAATTASAAPVVGP